ncbi:FUSC family protein [Flexivirga caeni]|uniref:FUSC family protein n=1 Tax=Flexivirga caeni TaxID=2294115 RepID=A0A3M9MFU4_9MICO|nr:FUSC family protein [Flexivirga caeni]
MAPPPKPYRPRSDLTDWFLAQDPGLNRLRMALQVVVSIAAALLAERIFVQTTGALQHSTAGLPPAVAAQVDAGNHAMLVVSMMVGAMICMIASFGAPMFATVRQSYLVILAMPVPMIAGLAIGLAVAHHRTLALTLLAVILAGGAYLRRFGPWGFLGAQMLFMGDFMGFFLGAELPFSALKWLAPEVFLGAIVACLAQLVLFHPSQRRTLRRVRRSFGSRARALVDVALEVLDDPDDQRAAARLRQRTVHLNETALMIDAALAAPGALRDGGSAAYVHQFVFDAEQTLANMARFAGTLGRSGLSRGSRGLVRTSLMAVGDHDPQTARHAATRLIEELRDVAVRPPADENERNRRVIVHRFATSVLDWADLAETPLPPRQDGDTPEFRSSVQLMGGWLPGSAMASADASTELGPRPIDRVRLAPNVRIAIQMAVAVTAAIVLGSMLSERRFYWAVIAAFVTFMGANNAGEQIRKGIYRVLGTLVGVFVGAVLAHLVGHRADLAVLTVLIAIGLGIYLMRISYAFMVIGITVMVSQLYVQLGEFSDSLLRLRLEETAIGAAVTILTVVLILPIRSRQVVRVAARAHAEAVRTLADGALRNATGHCSNAELLAAARVLDAAHQTLVASLNPLRGIPGLASTIHRQLRSSAAASVHRARTMLHESRRIAASSAPGSGLDADAGRLDDARRRLSDSIGAIAEALTQDNDSSRYTYVRSASLFDEIATSRADADRITPAQLLLRDARLLDESMATFAEAVRLHVRALDTVTA